MLEMLGWLRWGDLPCVTKKWCEEGRSEVDEEEGEEKWGEKEEQDLMERGGEEGEVLDEGIAMVGGWRFEECR